MARDMARYATRGRRAGALAGAVVVCALAGAGAGCDLWGSGSANGSPTATLEATSTASGTGTADGWATLRARPLKLPTLAPGAACPLLTPHTVSSDFGPVLGDGPVYPAGLTDGVLKYAPPANFGSQEWGGAKVLWAMGPQYQGDALIRGGQIDGANALRFEQGDVPPDELHVLHAPAGDGWTGQPSFTRVKAPGCYAYQVDGTTFSYALVFAATPR